MKSRLGIIPFLIAVSALMVSCKQEVKKVEQVPAVNVTVQPVQKTNSLQQLSYSGTIEPDNTVQVGFAVPGVVNNVAVQEGQSVNRGQLLASIDATEYSNALAIANAGLAQAEDMYARLNELYQKGSLPAKDYIEIKTKVAQARANKSINAKHIADSRLYAPMSGIVTSKMVERGSMAAPGVPAFVIVKTDKVYAKFSVSESEVGSIKKGTDAAVFIPTVNDSLKGKITIINPMADPVSKTYSIKIQLTNAGGKLMPGMLTNVRIKTDKSVDAILIPATAVVRDADDITYVFIVNAQNKAIRKRITTSTVAGMEQIMVTEGLNDGDKLVIAGQSRLKDGSAVSF